MKYLKDQYDAYVAIAFHVDGLMSDQTIGILTKVVKVQLPTTATKYQAFYNGILMTTELARERNIDTARIEVLNCCHTEEEAKATCAAYLQSIKKVVEAQPKIIIGN